MPAPFYRGLEIGDKVRVRLDARVTTIDGVLQRLPSVQLPYWEISHVGSIDNGSIFAFTGTVSVERLPE